MQRDLRSLRKNGMLSVLQYNSNTNNNNNSNTTAVGQEFLNWEHERLAGALLCSGAMVSR